MSGAPKSDHGSNTAVSPPVVGEGVLLAVHPRVVDLSPSERGVFERLLVGESNLEIARARGTSPRTVANQVVAIFRKTGVGSRRELIAATGEAHEPIEGASEARDSKPLTLRERQVTIRAALGQSNKVIASELGIAPSTVGVVFMRAAAKLEGKSRADLIRACSRGISDPSALDGETRYPSTRSRQVG